MKKILKKYFTVINYPKRYESIKLSKILKKIMSGTLSKKFKRVLITGGSGFIGSNLLQRLFKEKGLHIFNLDKLSYSSDKQFGNLLKNNETKYKFLKVDLNR